MNCRQIKRSKTETQSKRAQRAREIKTTPPKEADDRLIEATTKLQEVGNLKAKRFGQLAPHRSSERSRSNAMAMRCTMRCNARIVNTVTEHAERETGTNASDKGAISKSRWDPTCKDRFSPLRRTCSATALINQHMSGMHHARVIIMMTSVRYDSTHFHQACGEALGLPGRTECS